MNIAIFVDKYGTAIDRLAQAVKLNNPHFNIQVLAVHPKRNDAETLFQAQDLMRWADLIDVHYWKSGEILRQSFPVEWEAKPHLLCHFNPYDFDKMDWQKYYDAIVVGNKEIQTKMPYAHLIPYAIDLDFFTYQQKNKVKGVVNMVVNRIEGKKGVLEVAKACRDLGYKLLLVGRVSDGDYVKQVLDTGVVEFHENASEEVLRQAYYDSTIHVCNSVYNFESGTLPILEAMACGTVVLTRSVGHVPDLYDGKNMVVRKGEVSDVEDLKKELKELMENDQLRENLRENAWYTVKNRTDEKMARQFSTLYYKLLGGDKPLVSVIIPTFDRPESLIECLSGALIQDYGHHEVVVVDSGNKDVKYLVDAYRKTDGKTPLKYVRFKNGGRYTLAEARNRGVIEAEGETLIFCDDRLKMSSDAVRRFMEYSQIQTWLWGVKDGSAKAFVENFSSIKRKDLIKAGMFCERIDKYGGQSEELRIRFTQLGFGFENVPEANATSIKRAKGLHSKRADLIDSKLTLFKMYN